MRVSLPLKHGEAQQAQDLLSLYADNYDRKRLLTSATYLMYKSQQALEKNLEREASLLADLGKLAIDLFEDVSINIKNNY